MYRSTTYNVYWVNQSARKIIEPVLRPNTEYENKRIEELFQNGYPLENSVKLKIEEERYCRYFLGKLYNTFWEVERMWYFRLRSL